MNKKTLIGAIAVIVVLLFSGCVEEEEPFNINELTFPESRSFEMGFTPWPYDFSQEAIDETYSTIDEHADLVAHHLNEGIPWPEAFEGKKFHPNVEEDISNRLGRLQGKKVYLAVSPVGIDRTSLEDYRGETDNMERPGIWKNKDFDDPDVVLAYTNYCREMIQRFDPDYMAYGIEVNMVANSNPEGFQKYLALTEQVYKTLKEENPELPLFLTIQIDEFEKGGEKQRQAVQQLLPFTDYIAVSTYPFMERPNPEELPDNWFSQMQLMAPEKPFAIAETGYIAEDLSTSFLTVAGKKSWQAEYLQFVLTESNNLDAEFVVWFVSRDYDLLWERLWMIAPEYGKIWKDSGLLDGQGKQRPSLEIWDKWLGLEKK